ncbi:hypothetical protein SESBI_09686 [Sesbania bispinosa]|nr:hypothetical protein SESBI_09686 [Sesbania bispinosa]
MTTRRAVEGGTTSAGTTARSLCAVPALAAVLALVVPPSTARLTVIVRATFNCSPRSFPLLAPSISSPPCLHPLPSHPRFWGQQKGAAMGADGAAALHVAVAAAEQSATVGERRARCLAAVAAQQWRRGEEWRRQGAAMEGTVAAAMAMHREGVTRWSWPQGRGWWATRWRAAVRWWW